MVKLQILYSIITFIHTYTCVGERAFMKLITWTHWHHFSWPSIAKSYQICSLGSFFSSQQYKNGQCSWNKFKPETGDNLQHTIHRFLLLLWLVNIGEVDEKGRPNSDEKSSWSDSSAASHQRLWHRSRSSAVEKLKAFRI